MNNKKILSASTATLFFCAATQSFAAPVDDKDQAGKIEKVVVTAQKRVQSLQEVPISVSALNNGTLENSSIGDVTGISAQVAGLEYTPGFSGGSGANFFIRGIGQIDFISTTEPGVGVYLDGVYVARTVGASLDLLDVERVEVLRGPQGTLFGKNTIGGAVSISTIKPNTSEFTGVAKFTVGSRDRLNGGVSVNVPLIEDELALRLSMTSKNQDGFGKSLYDGIERSDEGKVAARARLLWEASDNLEILFDADMTKVDQEEKHIVALAINPDSFVTAPQNEYALENGLTPYDTRYEVGNDIYVNNSGFNPGNTLDVWGASTTITWDLDAVTEFRSISAYREMDSFTGIDGDASPISIGEQDVLDEQNQFSQEFLLSGLALNERLDWLIGAFYSTEEGFNEVYLPLSFPGNPDGYDTRTSNAYKNKSAAIYGQGTYSVTDKLSLIAGIRYTNDKKENTIRNIATKFNIDILPSTTSNDSWNSTTWRTGLNYQFDKDMLAYVTYSTGFKTGGFNGRAFSVGETEGYAPEKVNTFEVGLKGDYLDDRLRINTAFFYSDYEDIQATVNIIDSETGQPLNVIQNAAEAEIIGVELDVIAMLSDNLQLIFGATKTDAEYTKLDSGVSLTENDKLPQVPEQTYSIGLEYSRPVSTSFIEDGYFMLRGDYSYKGKTYFGSQNSDYNLEPEYGLLNLRASYGPDSADWTIAAYVLNATDEEYYVYREDLYEYMAAVAIPGAPREIGIEFTTKW